MSRNCNIFLKVGGKYPIKRFGLQSLTVRDQTANNLADVLDFTQRNVSFNAYPVPAVVSMPCVVAPVGTSAQDEFSLLRQYAQSLGFVLP